MSTGAIGTAVAQQQLRTILSFLGSPTLTQPEAYLQYRDGLITDEGQITDDSTAEFLANWLSAVQEHVSSTLTSAT